MDGGGLAHSARTKQDHCLLKACRVACARALASISLVHHRSGRVRLVLDKTKQEPGEA